MATPDRRKVDENGHFLPFPGYTIVAHAVHPLPEQLDQLVQKLQTSKLTDYFSFLPKSSYHVTINSLSGVRKHHLQQLIDEQTKLKEFNTSMTCTARRLIPTGVLRIEVDFADRAEDSQKKIDRARSNQLKEMQVLNDYQQSWHLTLAYKYKPTEKETIDKLIKAATASIRFPFEIPLESIQICSYEDMTKFTEISMSNKKT